MNAEIRDQAQTVVGGVTMLASMHNPDALLLFGTIWDMANAEIRQEFVRAWAVLAGEALGLYSMQKEMGGIVGHFVIQSDGNEVEDPNDPIRVFTSMMMSLVNDDEPLAFAAWQGLSQEEQTEVCAVGAQIVIQAVTKTGGGIEVKHKIIRPENN